VSSGLLALLDDVAGIAKVAAASIDDAASQAARAGVKAAGVVVDDAAVTPRYVVGFAADRELPIVWRIAGGSLRNKLVILLPAALLLSLFAPWAIAPLLVLGGLFLCYEGAEKVAELVSPHHGGGHAEPAAAADLGTFEDEKVAGAVRTDLILSAEIMAITLSTVAETTSSFWMQASVLALVAVGITAAVYGAVALIVKADDLGVALALRTGGGPADAALRAVGRGIVAGMPAILKGLGVLGTAAMLWVGGGIVVHGLEGFGVAGPAHVVHDVAHAAEAFVPAAPALAGWAAGAAASGLAGLALGAILVPLVHRVVQPAVARLRRRR
jgi:predicted DNA repair protein MutK